MTDFPIIILRFAGLPKMNTHATDYLAASRERKKWRQLSRNAAQGKRPIRPFSKATLTCVRFSSVECDYDNLVYGFKSLIDGLTDAHVIEDDKSRVIVHRAYSWQKAPPGEGAMEITITGHDMMSEEAYVALVKREIEGQLKKRLPRAKGRVSHSKKRGRSK